MLRMSFLIGVKTGFLSVIHINPNKYSGISIKRTPLVHRKSVRFYRDVRFIEIPPELQYKTQIKRKNVYFLWFFKIPVQYNFIGPEKAVEWAEKTVKRVIDKVDKKTEKCTN